MILGTLGGIGLLIGPAGLYSIKRRRDPAISDPRQNGADVSFLALLFATSLTGLLLLALRNTPEMGVLLRVHLGVVLALFLTCLTESSCMAPYRLAALIRYAFETASSGDAQGSLRRKQERCGQPHQSREGKPQARRRAIPGDVNQPRGNGRREAAEHSGRETIRERKARGAHAGGHDLGQEHDHRTVVTPKYRREPQRHSQQAV